MIHTLAQTDCYLILSASDRHIVEMPEMSEKREPAILSIHRCGVTELEITYHQQATPIKVKIQLDGQGEVREVVAPRSGYVVYDWDSQSIRA